MNGINHRDADDENYVSVIYMGHGNSGDTVIVDENEDDLLDIEDELREKEEEDEDKPQPKEVKKVDIPFTDYRMPVPEEEILVTAATTAAVSVAATLTATSLFKHCVKVFKPIFMQLVKRIQKKFKKDGDTAKEKPPGQT